MSTWEHEYEDKGVEFLAINAKEDPQRGRDFIAANDLDFRWMWADDAALDALGVQMVPAQIVVDREGKITWVSSFTSMTEGPAAIRKALDEAL